MIIPMVAVMTMIVVVVVMVKIEMKIKEFLQETGRSEMAMIFVSPSPTRFAGCR